MPLNYGVGEDSWESLGLQGDPTSPSWRRSVLGVHWKDWCWSWNSNTLATSCKELTHWKRPWCWEGLAAGGEGDGKGWHGWMTSPTRWTWIWVNSWSWWWTGRPGVLWFMGSQSWTRLSDWTELNGTERLKGEQKLDKHRNDGKYGKHRIWLARTQDDLLRQYHGKWTHESVSPCFSTPASEPGMWWPRLWGILSDHQWYVLFTHLFALSEDADFQNVLVLVLIGTV